MNGILKKYRQYQKQKHTLNQMEYLPLLCHEFFERGISLLRGLLKYCASLALEVLKETIQI